MLFARGGYQGLTAAGSEADRICAFARRKEEDALIVVVARFPVRCEGERDWGGTEIDWPHAVEGDAVWRDLFTGRAVERHRETFDVRKTCRWQFSCRKTAARFGWEDRPVAC
jgi:maltooligosyltrehalose synthase